MKWIAFIGIMLSTSCCHQRGYYCGIDEIRAEHRTCSSVGGLFLWEATDLEAPKPAICSCKPDRDLRKILARMADEPPKAWQKPEPEPKPEEPAE